MWIISERKKKQAKDNGVHTNHSFCVIDLPASADIGVM
jgi:hypothetical protein